MNKSICIVGGTFDINTTYGKASSVVTYLSANIIFSKLFESVYTINGGNYVNLRKMVEGNELSKYDIILCRRTPLPPVWQPRTPKRFHRGRKMTRRAAPKCTTKAAYN